MRRRTFRLIAAGVIATLVAVAGCNVTPDDKAGALRRDRELDEYIAAIEEALAAWETEEADAAYDLARKRMALLADIPYARKTRAEYHPRFVELAGRIIAAKEAGRGLVRVVLYRGYDPMSAEDVEEVYRVGSLYERLQRAPAHRRAEVERIIAQYLDSGRRQYEIYLRRMSKYRNHIERVFTAYGLPPELMCVAMIESAGDPTRVSHAGAAGLWQFIPETARRYKLVVARQVDQRFDPVLETYAAAAYLRDLMEMFGGDIEPALASYNAGEAFIADAVASAGSGGFWALKPRGSGDDGAVAIPRETYDYVARFFAVGIIYQNLSRYGFDQPPAADDPFVMLEMAGALDLGRLADDLGVDAQTLASMNGSFIETASGESVRTLVRLPALPVEDYVERLRATRRYGVSYVYRHKVTNYESLRAIAEDYGVSPSRLALHNNLEPDARLRPGMVLQVPSTMRNVTAASASERNLAWWSDFRARNRALP